MTRSILFSILVVLGVFTTSCNKTDDYVVEPTLTDVTASFTFTQNRDTVFFENNSKGYDEIIWDFGDKEQSKVENPVHIYKSSGVFVVVLTAIKDTIIEKYAKEVKVALTEATKPEIKVNTGPGYSNFGIQTIGLANYNFRGQYYYQVAKDSLFKQPLKGTYRFGEEIFNFYNSFDAQGRMACVILGLKPQETYYARGRLEFKNDENGNLDSVYTNTLKVTTRKFIKTEFSINDDACAGIVTYNKRIIGLIENGSNVDVSVSSYLDKELTMPFPVWDQLPKILPANSFYSPLGLKLYYELKADYPKYDDVSSSVVNELYCENIFIAQKSFSVTSYESVNYTGGFKLVAVKGAEKMVINCVNKVNGVYKIESETEDDLKNYCYYYSPKLKENMFVSVSDKNKVSELVQDVFPASHFYSFSNEVITKFSSKTFNHGAVIFRVDE